jgi:hypothetical protein
LAVVLISKTLGVILEREQADNVLQFAGIHVGHGPELHAIAGPVRDIELWSAKIRVTSN